VENENERDQVPYLVKLIKGWARTFLWIRIRMDLHHFDNLDPHPQHKCASGSASNKNQEILIRISVQIKSHNVPMEYESI
jgi:hypothetical protein